MGAGGGTRWPRWAGLVGWTVAVGWMAAVWGPPLLAHERATRDRFADDVCQHVAPFTQASTGAADTPRGYVDGYWRACLPIGYRAIYEAAARWGAARSLSHFLPYGLLAALALALALGGARFGGAAAAAGCAWAALGSEDFFTRMVGGLPRGFALPLVAAMAAFAVQGRIGWYVASVGLAFAFYPAVGVAGLLGLGLLLLLPAGDRGTAGGWSWRKRALALALAGGVCVLMVLPNVLALRPYGEGIGPDDVAQYPEAGPGGRLNDVDRADFAMPLAACVGHYAPHAIAHSNGPWRQALGWETADAAQRGYLWLAAGLVLVALPRLLRRNAAGRRLAALTAAAVLAYWTSRAATPLLFMPERHVAYAVPVLALLWLVAAAATLPRIGRKPEGNAEEAPARAGGICALALVAAGVFLLGGTTEPIQGTVENPDPALYEFLGTLPEVAFIAGWPDQMSPVPYLSGRPALLSYETHLPYHKAYSDELRQRMRDLTAAYFAADPAPLAVLRNRYGVTHLVVDERHYAYPPPRHSRLYYRETKAAYRAGRTGGFETGRQRSRAVYDRDGRFVLDLARLGE